MKYILVGVNTALGDLTLKKPKNHDKFGSMYYLKEKLCLYSTIPINEYNVWKTDEGKCYLCIRNNASKWQQEFARVCAELKKQNGNMFNFKEQNGDELFLKLNPNLSHTVPQKHNLYITVEVYGVFVQSISYKAFLQMELLTFNAEPISFNGLTYDPNPEIANGPTYEANGPNCDN